jgi:Zn-dependent protease
MFDLSGQQVLFRIASALFIAGTHGYALALMARLIGDPGPGYDRRLTLNPLQQAQFLGFLSTVLFRIGWIRPMAIDHTLLRFGRAGLFLVVLGALGATLLIAEGLWLLRPWLLSTFSGTTAIQGLVLWFENVAMLSTAFVVFNLIPVPPFAMGHMLAGFAPRLHALLVRHIVIPALAIAVILLLADRAGLVAPVVRAIFARLFE